MKSNKPVVIIDTDQDAMVCFVNGFYIGHDDQVNFRDLLIEFGVAEVVEVEDLDWFLDNISGVNRLQDVPEEPQKREDEGW